MKAEKTVYDDDLRGEGAWVTSTPHQPATAGFVPVLRVNPRER